VPRRRRPFVRGARAVPHASRATAVRIASIVVALALPLSPHASGAQQVPAAAASAAAAPDTAWKGGPFDRLSFRNIGPTGPSGRIDDFAVLESNPNIFYIGTATGGVWKSENGGVTLTPVFDSMSVSSIGDVTIPTDDPNLVWVGTGENNNRQSSSWGDGVYKSTDGGKHWRNMGLRESRQIARIVIDPVDHEVVLVAALGDLWRPGGDRGIFRTADGGNTWTKVLDVGPDAGGTDLVMDPRNNKVVYAATYQRRRASFGFNGGGTNSGIWKSSDGGKTWARLTNGLPDGAMGRIGLDIFRGNPNIVYARVEHEKQGGVYRTDDGGSSWRKMGSHNMRPMYFGIIRVDPQNDLRVYLPETPLGISDDGGKTFRFDGAERIHVDHHAMWIDPHDPSHMMIGNDGGVSVSHDKGKKWQWFPHLLVAQFYHVGYDMQVPYNVCGGLQDNNSWCGPSQVRTGEGISDHDWWSLAGGDGFVNLIDPTDARLIYTSSQEGYISRMDKVTGEQKGIRPEAPANEKKYRWNWDTPFILSPHDPATVYIGGNRLFRSTDRGSSWTPISPDLTTGVDRDSLQLMGAKLKDVKIAKNDGIEDYATLFTVAESRRVRGVIYTGSDDGQVQLTRDGGATWTNLTPKIPGAPRWAYVSRVEPSRFADGTVYVSFDAHRTGDYSTYAFVSTDFGATFRSIAGNLPKGEVVRCITEDLKNADVLYLGTETGLWVSTDRGKGWTRVRANLPTVPVYEITLHPRDNAMILATHGRGIWILDDLTPFQEASQAQAVASFLYPIPTTQQQTSASLRFYFFQGDMQFLGPNPPLGVPIAFWLKTKADSVRLVLKDGVGNVVRELSGTDLTNGLNVGMNRVIWDFRIAPIPQPKWQAAQGGGGPGGGGAAGGGPNPGTQGPWVLPGTFTATLFVNGAEAASRPFTVTGDREVTITDADRQRRFDLLKEGQRLDARLSEAVAAMRAAKTQFDQLKTLLADSSTVPADIRTTFDTLSKQLKPFVRRFYMSSESEPDSTFEGLEFRAVLPFKLGGLLGGVGGATMPVNATDLAQWAELQREVPAAIDEVNAFLVQLRPFYAKLAEAGLFPVVPKPIEKP